MEQSAPHAVEFARVIQSCSWLLALECPVWSSRPTEGNPASGARGDKDTSCGQGCCQPQDTGPVPHPDELVLQHRYSFQCTYGMVLEYTLYTRVLVLECCSNVHRILATLPGLRYALRYRFAAENCTMVQRSSRVWGELHTIIYCNSC